MIDATLRLRIEQLWRDHLYSYNERCKSRLWRWSINWRTRKQLKTLNHDQLEDIGISSNKALKEARKPFWVD